MAKYKFYISTGYVGADVSEVVEFPDEELEGMAEKEVEDYIQAEYDMWVSNNAELSWWKVEG